ncbi:MAG TPA: CoA ester lyase, partial [Solirubrobacter sp.]|nr:CoA ester lyase [Solirubrobacter sp.]
RTVVVRVNGTDTPHYYRDLIAVVERAGDRLDAIMLPKVRTPGDVEMTAKLLTQIELANDLEVGRIGIEAQIEDATGLLACEAIAAASPRMETLIFGPGDYSAAVGIPLTTIGAAPEGYPGDHLNYVYSRLVVAARAAGIQAIDGPYARVGDDAGLRERSALARALGLDGKWTIHPGQIAIVNEVFSPPRDQWERAEAMLAAYDEAHRDGRGAAVFEGEMIDEANRKMAERIAEAGRAAGYAR